MKRFSFPASLIVFSCLMLSWAGCSDSPTNPTDEPLVGPTSLRACSDTNSVALLWNPSASEFQSNFAGYLLTVHNKTTDSSFTRSIAKGLSTFKVTGLKNGMWYAFILHAISDKGHLSPDSAKVDWSPAIRHSLDNKKFRIRVFATTSDSVNGLDLNNDAGEAERLKEISPAFKQRADLLVYTPNIISPLVISSPHKSLVNPGLVTEFSTVSGISANSLDEVYATASPSTSTYTAYEITIDDAPVTKGRIYFGRVQRGNDRYYFRLLVKRGNNSSLVQGESIDRYLEFEISYQDVRLVPFAKR